MTTWCAGGTKQNTVTHRNMIFKVCNARTRAKTKNVNNKKYKTYIVCLCFVSLAITLPLHVASVDAEQHHNPLWSLPFQWHLCCPLSNC